MALSTIRGLRADRLIIDDPFRQPQHYVEPLVVEWVGQCIACRAVHIRDMPSLMDHGEDERRYYDHVGEYGGAIDRYMLRNVGTRMRRACHQPTEEQLPDPRADFFRTRTETVPCEGYVFEVPGQSAMLSAWALGGADAVFALVMDPDRLRTQGELICMEEALRRR